MKNEVSLYNKKLMKNGDVDMWMCFPGVYSFSLSSIGYLWICKEFDLMDDVNLERVCSDTVSTMTRPEDVDLIGFSFSFDLDFINIFNMLKRYHIPLKSFDRTDEMPLVFSGGPVVTANPLPYKDFFDFFIIGDSENVNCKLVEIFRDNKGKKRSEILKMLSEVEGVYVPNVSKKVRKITADLSECVYTPILSDKAFFKNTFIVEVARGCSNCCAFCIASYLNLPQRSVDYKKIINALELGLQHTNKIALLGANVCGHPDFERVCEFILKRINSGENIEMTISSIRADKLSPIVVETLVKTGQKTATIAVEAGSERLRKVINKNLSNEQLFKTIQIAKDYGLKGLKIYAMFGIPSEMHEDLEELVNLAKTLKKKFKGFDLTYSFASFVPKAHTPFQWCGRESTKSLEEKQNYLKKEFHKLGLKARFSSIKWDFYQALLSRGGADLTDYILDVYRSGANLGAFKTSATGRFDLEKYVLQDFNLDSDLPWDFIEMAPSKENLKKEYQRLLR